MQTNNYISDTEKRKFYDELAIVACRSKGPKIVLAGDHSASEAYLDGRCA